MLTVLMLHWSAVADQNILNGKVFNLSGNSLPNSTVSLLDQKKP